MGLWKYCGSFETTSTGCPRKHIHALTADSSILKIGCILINTAFVIIPSVYTFFGGTPCIFTSLSQWSFSLGLFGKLYFPVLFLGTHPLLCVSCFLGKGGNGADPTVGFVNIEIYYAYYNFFPSCEMQVFIFCLKTDFIHRADGILYARCFDNKL